MILNEDEFVGVLQGKMQSYIAAYSGEFEKINADAIKENNLILSDEEFLLVRDVSSGVLIEADLDEAKKAMLLVIQEKNLKKAELIASGTLKAPDFSVEKIYELVSVSMDDVKKCCHTGEEIVEQFKKMLDVIGKEEA